MLYKRVNDGVKDTFIVHTDRSEWPDKASCMARIAHLHKIAKLQGMDILYPTDAQRRRHWLKWGEKLPY
jgi:hypothetical protein